ncbi:SurA N-terminal domain-containing protein [Nonomuraea sp. NPDC049309]|uniref:SurA N-terminal domain-containing protein n=1 Tax=Nonomuraea sp. NPDC049309 TaxID=3364350 RepID=UPI0037137050
MKSIRVAVAAAAAAVALSACSSPMQAGAAAVVGSERISMSKLHDDTQEYIAALKRANLDESALSVPVSQAVLRRLVDVAASKQLMARYNVQVTESEVDATLKDPGQYESAEINLLANAVSPADARDYGRAMTGLRKLQEQFGQSGQQRLLDEFNSVKRVINPRFGKLNTDQSQPGLFVDAGRFGKAGEQAAQG